MMLDGLRKLLRSTMDPGTSTAVMPGDDVEPATAALPVEMARADFAEELLGEGFTISGAEITALVDKAKTRADDAVSLHEFTRLLNEQLDAQEKLAVVEMLWRLSLADGRIDKHEEHLVRKVAGLLHVPDRDMIATKLKATDAQSAERRQRQ